MKKGLWVYLRVGGLRHGKKPMPIMDWVKNENEWGKKIWRERSYLLILKYNATNPLIPGYISHHLRQVLCHQRNLQELLHMPLGLFYLDLE